MAGSLIGALRVMLGMDSAEFEKGATSAERRAARMEKNFKALGGRMTDLGKTLSVAATAPLVGLGVTAVQAAMESQDAIAQVEASLGSMGNAAGRTSEQLQALASKQMSQSLYDDDEILRSVTANLLTFGNIAGQEFDRAQQAALDMSAKLGKGLQESTVMIGKALNDPIRGVSALGEAGIQFTEQQKDMIKTLWETGDAAGAQQIILKELERQFENSAKKARDANPFAAVKQDFAEFQENVGAELLKAMPAITGAITSMLGAFNSLGPGMQQVVVIGGVLAAALGPVLIGLGSIVSVAGPAVTGLIALKKAFDFAGIIKNIIPMIGMLSKALLGLLANPIVLGAAAVIGGIYLAWQNWDKIAPIIDSVSAAITSWYEGTVKPVFDKVMAVLEPFVTFFKDFFGAQIKGTLDVISALLKGDFSGAWDAAKAMATNMLNALVNLAATVGPAVVGHMKALYEGVKAWLMDKLGAVFKWVGDKVSWVGDQFFKLYDAVVGHSYIPDMVTEIGEHMARLTGLMVVPAQRMTHATAKAFEGLAGEVAATNDRMADRIEVTAERVSESFASMVENITGALGSFVDSIKKGDIFDIIGGLLNVLDTVGQAVGGFKIGPMVFGGAGTGGTRAPGGGSHGGGQLPRFANGGAMRFGGFGGIDRNLLSLNGNPIARVSRGETMQVSPGSVGGALRVTVTMDESTGALGAFVQDQAGRVVAKAAPALVRAGGAAGVARMGRMQGRRLG